MNLGDLKNIDLFSVGVAVAAIGTLGFLIFFNNRRSITNKTYLAFSIAAIAWSIFNYINYQFADPVVVLWLLRFVMFSAVWYSFFLFQLFKVFPEEKYVFSSKYKYALLPAVIVTSLLTLTPYVFTRVGELAPVGQVSSMVPGRGIIIFGLTVVFLIFSGLFILMRKTYRAKPPTKTSFMLVFTGAAITFVLHLAFNFILPAFFEVTKFIPFGAVFTFPLAAFMAYAIGRHRLLNVKAFAAELLTFFLAVVTLFELIISESLGAVILRLGVFCLVLGFGILLIRNVLREVEQREKLEVLTKELAAANEKLKELDRLKSEFLSFASHQIKAPLAAIKGYATLIFDGSYGQVPENVKETALKIKNSSDRLTQLVINFINVRKIEEGKMEFKFEKINCSELVKEVAEEFEPLARSKNLNYSFESASLEILVGADAQSLRQVFQNLIENAIKYTDTGFVKVKTEVKGGNMVFSVSDSGHGISKDVLSHLFEKFKRDGKEKQIEGTGLGLYIAKNIVEAHHGKIWAESEGEERGSIFFVELPLM